MTKVVFYDINNYEEQNQQIWPTEAHSHIFIKLPIEVWIFCQKNLPDIEGKGNEKKEYGYCLNIVPQKLELFHENLFHEISLSRISIDGEGIWK